MKNASDSHAAEMKKTKDEHNEFLRITRETNINMLQKLKSEHSEEVSKLQTAMRAAESAADAEKARIISEKRAE